MGKKQHSKDRMFITKTEWATEWGGAKSKENRTPFKRLPFYCCSLTFTPFEYPVCTPDGSVFDVMLVSLSSVIHYFYFYIFQLFDRLVLQFGHRNITPYIIKYGKHPVTGTPLKQDDLIPLTFHKNSEGYSLSFPNNFVFYWIGFSSLFSLKWFTHQWHLLFYLWTRE